MFSSKIWHEAATFILKTLILWLEFLGLVLIHLSIERLESRDHLSGFVFQVLLTYSEAGKSVPVGIFLKIDPLKGVCS